MSVPIVKEYKISDYKDLKIGIEKMWWLKTIIVSVIMGKIKKGTDKHITIYSPSKYKKFHFAELLIFLGEYYQCKKVSKVGDHSRGRPEGFLFNSYYTEV